MRATTQAGGRQRVNGGARGRVGHPARWTEQPVCSLEGDGAAAVQLWLLQCCESKE